MYCQRLAIPFSRALSSKAAYSTASKPPTIEDFDPLNPGQWQLGAAGKILPRLPEGNLCGKLVIRAWDQADSRFEINQKQVNPNIAADLIAEVPPKPVEDRVVSCSGGHPALGHPLVFIKLDKPGTHACGYCGQRFYNTHSTKKEDLDVHHIEV